MNTEQSNKATESTEKAAPNLNVEKPVKTDDKPTVQPESDVANKQVAANPNDLKTSKPPQPEDGKKIAQIEEKPTSASSDPPHKSSLLSWFDDNLGQSKTPESEQPKVETKQPQNEEKPSQVEAKPIEAPQSPDVKAKEITPGDVLEHATNMMQNGFSGHEEEADKNLPPTRILLAFSLVQTALHWLTDDWYVNLRPVKEFMKMRFKISEVKNDWNGKVEKKFDYFLSNYLLVSAVTLVLAIIFSGLGLCLSILIPVWIAFASYKLERKTNGVLTIRGFQISFVNQLIIMTVFMTPFWVHYGLISAIHWTVLTTVGFVLFHGTFHSGTPAGPSAVPVAN